MKKIAYIEIDTHAEIARNFLELMEGSSQFAVDYYFSEKILQQVGKHQHNVFVTESSMLLEQLQKQQYDLVIVGTVHRYFSVFHTVVKSFNTSVLIHNLNFAEISGLNLLRTVPRIDFVFRLKLLLKESLLTAPTVYRNAGNRLVLDQGMVSRNVKFLPVLFNEFNSPQTSERFTIIIPGTVSQLRRDYHSVLKKLGDFKTNLQIVFLGKASGQELQWLIDFEKVKIPHLSLKFFTETLSAEEFSGWMQKASVLWCPLQRETSFFSRTEIYGETKMTGNIGDAIKFGKCAVFPRHYPVAQYPFILNDAEDTEQQLLAGARLKFDFQESFSKNAVSAALHKVLHQLM